MFKQLIASVALMVSVGAHAQNVLDVYKNLAIQRMAPQNPVVVYILSEQIRKQDQQRYEEESRQRMEQKSQQGQQFLHSLKQKQGNNQ